MQTKVFDEFIAPIQVAHPKTGEMHRPILHISMTVVAEHETQLPHHVPRVKGRLERVIRRAEREFFRSWSGGSLSALKSDFSAWLKDHAQDVTL